MTIKSVRGLGVKGLILDQDPYDVPMDALSDGNNIRITDGKVARMTGSLTRHTVAAYHMAPWFQANTPSYVLVTASAWQRYTSATVFSTVTPSTSFSDTTYNSTLVGDHLIINNQTEAPFIMGPTDSQFATLTNWPSTLRCSKIIEFNGFLVAIGLVDNGVQEPYTLRFSDTVTGTTVQPSWDITATDNLAGENELQGGDGPIVDAKQLGDQLIIYMRDAAHAMQFIGGNFVFGFRKIFDDDGLINQGAVAEFGGRHLVVGQDEIYIHDGNQKRSISDGRVSKFFYANMRNPESVRVERIIERDEIWILYSESDSSNANKALIYNYQYDCWTRMDLPNDIKQVLIGPKFGTALTVWTTTSGTWADQSDSWNVINPNATDKVPYYVGTTKIYQADTGFSVDGTTVTSFIEQSKLDLDELFGETQSLKKIKRILPQISGTGNVILKAGASNTPLGNVNFNRESTYDIETNHKVDLRAQGRYLALRMEMSGFGQYEITGWDLDLVRGHGR